MNLEQFSIEYIVVAMAAMILYLIYYVFAKDSEYHKNIHSVASVVEDLNRELYYLKKKLQESENVLKNSSTHMSDEEIYQEIEALLAATRDTTILSKRVLRKPMS